MLRLAKSRFLLVLLVVELLLSLQFLNSPQKAYGWGGTTPLSTHSNLAATVLDWFANKGWTFQGQPITTGTFNPWEEAIDGARTEVDSETTYHRESGKQKEFLGIYDENGFPRDVCPTEVSIDESLGAENRAVYWTQEAKKSLAKYNSTQNIDDLNLARRQAGYAIHYAQDTVAPPHVEPWAQWAGPHTGYEAYVTLAWGTLFKDPVYQSLSQAQISFTDDSQIVSVIRGLVTETDNDWPDDAAPCQWPTYEPEYVLHPEWTLAALNRAASLTKAILIYVFDFEPPTTRVAYLYSSWGMRTMQDEMATIASLEPGKYNFISFNENSVNELWANLNSYRILLIDEDTFYPDSSWSQLGGPIYDSFKTHAPALDSFVRNGGAIFTSGENDLRRTQAWDWLPPGMQVTSYDPETRSNVHIVYDPGAPKGLYSYPNIIADSSLSQGHTHAWFASWDPGYNITVRRNDNNQAIELFGVFGKGCIVASHIEAESGPAWQYMQNQLKFILPSVSYTLSILSPQPGQSLYVGQKVTIRVAIKDTDGNLVSGATVTANSPSGTPITLAEILHSPGTGIYEAIYTILPTDPTGDWVLTIVASIAGEFPKLSVQTQVLPFIPVSIDIKPGGYPNSINLGAKGVVPVAILTTPSFDASTVDATTVTLAGAGGQLRGKSGKAGALEDIDGDGDLDLVIQANVEELGSVAGATEAELTAYTYGGILIKGSDSVNIVPWK